MDKKIVTQRFGNRSKVERYSGGVNRGTDFGVAKGTPITVPEGRWQIVEAYDKARLEGPNNRQRGVNKGYGNSIVVQNLDTKEKLRFSHLSKVLTKGGTVEGGTVVGLSGATGNVAGKTGQHLDLEYFDSKGRLRDVMASRYANAPIIASAETNDQSVSGYYTTNTGSTNKTMDDTEWTAIKNKALLFAKKKGLNVKKTQELLDYAEIKWEGQKGYIKPEDVEDPSLRGDIRESQKGLSVEDLETPAEKKKREEEEKKTKATQTEATKAYISELGSYKTREEALKEVDLYKPIMEREGVDIDLVLSSVDKLFPEAKTQEEDILNIFRPGSVEKLKNLFRPTKKPSKDIFGALSGGA